MNSWSKPPGQTQSSHSRGKAAALTSVHLYPRLPQPAWRLNPVAMSPIQRKTLLGLKRETGHRQQIQIRCPRRLPNGSGEVPETWKVLVSARRDPAQPPAGPANPTAVLKLSSHVVRIGGILNYTVKPGTSSWASSNLLWTLKYLLFSALLMIIIVLTHKNSVRNMCIQFSQHFIFIIRVFIIGAVLSCYRLQISREKANSYYAMVIKLTIRVL